MDFNELKELIAQVNQSGLTSFSLEMDNISISMKKGSKLKNTPLDQAVEVSVDGALAYPDNTALAAASLEDVEGMVVKSPIVGTFYASPSPDSPAYARVGTKVSKGDVLCIIEAMKVMNDITSEYDGEIAEIYVVNEQIIEYGQPLFRIV